MAFFLGEMTLWASFFWGGKDLEVNILRGTFLTCCLLLYVFAPMAVRNLSVLKATEKGDWAPDPETEPEGYHDFSVPMDMRNPRKVHLLISLLRI